MGHVVEPVDGVVGVVARNVAGEVEWWCWLLRSLGVAARWRGGVVA